MREPVRILHAVVNMNRGGAETLLMNLYRSIDRNRIQFDFLTSFEGVYDDEIRRLGGRIYRIPSIRSGPKKYVKGLDQFFHEHPETIIIHAHMDKLSGIVLERAHKAGVPIRIAHSHNTSSEGSSLIKMYKWGAGKKIKFSATHFIACSKEAGRWLFPDQNDYLVLTNTIRTESFLFNKMNRRRIRVQLGLDETHTLFGHVGRFQTQKNHVFLLKRFAAVHASEPAARLILIGAGPLETELRKLASRLGISNYVLFAGIQEDIEGFLHAMDVFVFPSLHEGLPVSVIEAQAAGLPCLLANTITPDIDIQAGLCRFLPLSEPERWEKMMRGLALRRNERCSRLIEKKAGRFDSLQAAKDLQSFYESRVREAERYGTDYLYTNV
ncbi:glycosyltransferase family 1 protein [Bacillus daqingensis]|uniref:Glycosyltransferase family 1 protein n=1 Tax=Bacillus daqingensis TaxID=872396 RepID=A0ABV9NTW8_9BACI